MESVPIKPTKGVGSLSQAPDQQLEVSSASRCQLPLSSTSPEQPSSSCAAPTLLTPDGTRGYSGKGTEREAVLSF